MAWNFRTESIGFEPMSPLTGAQFSKLLPWTTRPTLHRSLWTMNDGQWTIPFQQRPFPLRATDKRNILNIENIMKFGKKVNLRVRTVILDRE